MTLHQSIHQDANLAGLLTIRPLTIDDLAQARTLHAEAFRFSARTVFPDADFAAALLQITTPEYTDHLATLALYGGFMDDSLVATAGWTPLRDHDGTSENAAAEIAAVAVAPIFTDAGLGRRMVAEVEAQAGAAGNRRFQVRATPHAVPFFMRIGYDLAPHASAHADRATALPSISPIMTLRKTLPSVGF